VEGVDPFWVTVRHADILEISRQNDLFLNGARNPVITTQAADRKVREMMGGSPHLLRTLIHMDAPDHLKYRILTQAWFLPQNLRSMEARIRVIARAAVEKMAATGGRCDFVRDVALHYPLHVIMTIMGVPEEDEPRMLKLTQEIFGAADPELGRNAAEAMAKPPQEREFDFSVITDFFDYYRRFSEAKRANPSDDLGSLIANSMIDGQPLSDLEAMSYYIIVATAGHDTTSSSTAGAMWALAEGRPVADPRPGGRIHPLDHAGEDLHAHGGSGHRSGRAAGQEGRLDHALLRLGQPRRGGVRGPLPVPRGPQAQPAPGVRLRRAPVPGPAPGEDGDADPVGGADPQARERRAGRRAGDERGGVRQRTEAAADPLQDAVTTGDRPAEPHAPQAPS
jgi:hypothetical protein